MTCKKNSRLLPILTHTESELHPLPYFPKPRTLLLLSAHDPDKWS